MTCRHSAYDSNCSSYANNMERLKRDYQEQILKTVTPDANDFEILDAIQCYGHLLLKVKYPNCKDCSFEGTKLLVYLETEIKTVFKWKKIDPHFRNTKPGPKEAPSPDARFPASPEGETHARLFMMSIPVDKVPKMKL